MSTESKVTILLDMDGVITDFRRHSLALYGVTEDKDSVMTALPKQSEEDVLGITRSEFWDTIAKAGVDFWRYMPEMPWTSHLLRCLGNFASEMHVITSPEAGGTCAVEASQGKVLWLQDRWGSKFDKFIITKHKYLLSRAGHILIDDYAKNCRQFEEHGKGRAILFPGPDFRGDKVAHTVHEMTRIIKHRVSHDKRVPGKIPVAVKFLERSHQVQR